MPKIRQSHIRSWRILAPPLDEQRLIASFIATETQRIDAAITRANREIELLNEYRTRLIADVVTGKLDVREAAASFPDESEEPEVADDLLPESDEPEPREPTEEECDE